MTSISAEERYIYEKLKSEKNVVSQLLFVSDVLTVSSAEAELIKENIEKFEKFGYGIEFLKENELIFRKVPQLIAKVNPKEILSEILENIEGDIDGLEEKILITTSCKASVKAGQKLSTWQMQEIIKRWRTGQKCHTLARMEDRYRKYFRISRLHHSSNGNPKMTLSQRLFVQAPVLALFFADAL